jgi:hypothetical protein
LKPRRHDGTTGISHGQTRTDADFFVGELFNKTEGMAATGYSIYRYQGFPSVTPGYYDSASHVTSFRRLA